MPNDPRDSSTRGVPGWARLLLAGLAVAGLILAGRAVGGQIPRFAQWVEGLGPGGPAVFIAGYVLGAVLFVPGSLLTLAAGAIFGLGRGTLFVFVGATLGAAAAFLVSRHVLRRPIEARLRSEPRFAAIDRAVSAEGWKIVLLLRLSPLVPYTLLNYLLGITRVRFRDFVVGSFGMLPGTLLYVYYGRLAGDVAALAGGAAVPRGPAHYALLVAGLAATVAVTAVMTRAARRALGERGALG